MKREQVVDVLIDGKKQYRVGMGEVKNIRAWYKKHKPNAKITVVKTGSYLKKL